MSHVHGVVGGLKGLLSVTGHHIFARSVRCFRRTIIKREQAMAFVTAPRYRIPMPQRCIHDLLPGECGFCKDLPFGLNGVVYRTTFGKAFHNWNNCEYLEDGQKFAESKGGAATEIIPTTWSSANQSLYPCEWCCALFYSRGVDLEDCLVTTNSGQVPAKIVKDRYLGRNIRQFQIYFPETNEIEIMLSRYVVKYK